MTTISNVSSASSAASILANLNSIPAATSAQNISQTTPSTAPITVEEQTTFTQSVANQLASLTYSSAGKLHSAPHTQASAQAALVAAETAITQTLADLMNGATSGISGSSGTDMFGASTSSTMSSLTGFPNNLSSAPQTQASAQAAYDTVEAAINQTLTDLMSSSTSGTSGASSTDIFGASTSSTATNDPTGLLNNMPASVSSDIGSNLSVAADTKAQAVQKAYMAAQDAVTQAQISLMA